MFKMTSSMKMLRRDNYTQNYVFSVIYIIKNNNIAAKEGAGRGAGGGAEEGKPLIPHEPFLYCGLVLKK